VLARRTRLLATLAMLGTSAAFILLMLALASELTTLENDPSALGQRYQLLATLPHPTPVASRPCLASPPQRRATS